MHRLAVVAAAVLAVVAGTARANTVINTIPLWDGSVSQGWDKIAQSFLVTGADTTLSSFRLRVVGSTFNVTLHAWDAVNNRALGGPLYDSGAIDASDRLMFFDFAIGAQLVSGETYAIIVDWTQGGGVAFSFADQYSGGYNDYTNGSIFDPWQFGPDTEYEMAFRAVFTVPGPGALALLGVAGLLGRRRRRE